MVLSSASADCLANGIPRGRESCCLRTPHTQLASPPPQSVKTGRTDSRPAGTQPILHIAQFLGIGSFADLPHARYSATDA